MTDPRLHIFLTTLPRGNLQAARVLIEQACANGHGTWLSPDSPTRRPATHMVEIDLFGAFATGTDALDATNHWLTVARAQTEQVAA